MAFVPLEDQISDDEIFFGKLSLKELKKHILWNKNPPNKIHEENHPLDHDHSLNIKSETEPGDDLCLKIIETHSEPNLRSPKDSSEFYSQNLRASDDSFLKIENMVENLCVSSNAETNEELNNTLDVINYILNNGPDSKSEVKIKVENEFYEKECSDKEQNIKSSIQTELIPSKSPHKTVKDIKEYPSSPCYATPLKVDKGHTPYKAIEFSTPFSSNIKKDVFKTPSTNPKYKTPVFKTPAPLSQKKSVSSIKKTPSKSNSYEHISSPIASYINNCPQVPLVKDVHPKKPLPGPSSIPKFIKSPKIKADNKENINLPSVAYKSAKKTKVIEVPDKEKLPQSQWVKKMTSTLPKPVVMKHNHREMNIAKRSLMQEESFADLPYRQAEVSVCTQKTAFKSNKNT